MLSRRLANLWRVSARCFAEVPQTKQAEKTQPEPSKTKTSTPLESRVEELQPRSIFTEVDFSAIPTATLGNFKSTLEQIVVDFSNSLRTVAGGKGNISFFNNIYVYSFLEPVLLTEAAVVKPLKEGEYELTVLEPSNAPMVELALKQSPYNLTVERDFERITVSAKVDKQNSVKVSKQMFEQAKTRLESAKAEAIKKYESRGKALVRDIETSTEHTLDVLTEMLKVKEAQLK